MSVDIWPNIFQIHLGLFVYEKLIPSFHYIDLMECKYGNKYKLKFLAVNQLIIREYCIPIKCNFGGSVAYW